ncbi:hypothetical protein PN419_00610 [Halorubrum ezzemoulense]|uniref:hypothetical protein n=1 Tax=Halorubrum ezzemoulense TaxID=337243 RepID=UPI00232E04CF|nr:hypothetical protein [Halorubrum ezzemoulense]MDB9247509.1 hypothetical protein [Halorubrum ezzemoulense]MDB9258582.1 hypothetical protein [Halorubrum ezzemoulense]MDB9264559.1 hypothetical protein [Halorubrum ezzemoulense]MDB9268943.1 hypothetical protein [Halorubrum ezzemoulense]MDB9271527.1 hypothetical protein [Halorubrum ezzemoulense]
MAVSSFTLRDVALTLVWAIIIPVCSIYAYGHGATLLANLLALVAFALAWFDVVERNVTESR